MNGTVVIDTKTGNEMIKLFKDLKYEVTLLRKAISNFYVTPKEESYAWWNYMDKKALSKIKNGQGIILENKKDIDKFFKTL